MDQYGPAISTQKKPTKGKQPYSTKKSAKTDEKSNVLPRQQRRQNARELSKAKLQSDLQSTSSKTKLSTEAAYRDKLRYGNEILTMLSEGDVYKTNPNEQWSKVLRRMSIPMKLGDLFHTWLIGLKTKDGSNRFNEAEIPKSGSSAVKPDLLIPPPYGEVWYTIYAM